MWLCVCHSNNRMCWIKEIKPLFCSVEGDLLCSDVGISPSWPSVVMLSVLAARPTPFPVITPTMHLLWWEVGLDVRLQKPKPERCRAGIYIQGIIPVCKESRCSVLSCFSVSFRLRRHRWWRSSRKGGFHVLLISPLVRGVTIHCVSLNRDPLFTRCIVIEVQYALGYKNKSTM